MLPRMGDGVSHGAVVGIAIGGVVLGFLAGCTVGVVTSSDHSDSSSRSASSIAPPTRTSPIPLTPYADADSQFFELVRTIPIGNADAKLLAASSCSAFKQNPGTSIDHAAEQIAGQQSWSTSQAAHFLDAATSTYCPQYRNGS